MRPKQFKTTSVRLITVLILVSATISALWNAGLSAAFAASSAPLFNYQGQLLDAAGNPVTTPEGEPLPMSFRLYAVASGGEACWSEDHTVDVQGGLFHVLLGQTVTIDPNACLVGDAYLELVVDGETMSPRELLTSVPRAVETGILRPGAQIATENPWQFEQLGAGSGAATVLRSTVNSQDFGFANQDGSPILTIRGDNVSGGYLNLLDHPILNAQALHLKDFDDDTGGTDDKYRLLARDGAWMFHDGGVVVGSYADNTWADLADGTLIVEGNLGIGTTNPQARLAVGMSGGAAAAQIGNSVANMVELGWDGRPYLQAQDSATADGYGLALNPYGGNVGIGTSTPAHKLDVAGSVRAGGLLVMGGSDLIMEEITARGGGRALVNDTGDTLTINYGGDFAGGVKIDSNINLNGHSVTNCGALTEANLQTPGELAAGRIDRFQEGDVLCWGIDQLELCAAEDDRLVQAVADAFGRPIVIGAERIKVIGPVARGDVLVSSALPGYAMVNNDPKPGSVIAQALVDFEQDRGLIKAMIRKW